MKKEVWKDVKGFEGRYKVSNLGRIMSIVFLNSEKNPKWSYKPLGKRILKPFDNGRGYDRVYLSKDGIIKKYSVHRLVAINFLPNDNDKLVVNHINHIKTDNRLENLEWVTQKENTQHALLNGLIKPLGINNNFSKLSEEQVLLIKKRLLNNIKVSEIVKEIKIVKPSTIYDIKNKKTWRHISPAR